MDVGHVRVRCGCDDRAAFYFFAVWIDPPIPQSSECEQFSITNFEAERLPACVFASAVTRPLIPVSHVLARCSQGALEPRWLLTIHSAFFQFSRAYSSQSWSSNFPWTSENGETCSLPGSVPRVTCQQHRSQSHPNHVELATKARRRSCFHCKGFFYALPKKVAWSPD